VRGSLMRGAAIGLAGVALFRIRACGMRARHNARCAWSKERDSIVIFIMAPSIHR
jgi:hypothetical protein